jgi:hypothetical protein
MSEAFEEDTCRMLEEETAAPPPPNPFDEMKRLADLHRRAGQLMDELRASIALRTAYGLPMTGVVSVQRTGTTLKPAVVVRHEGEIVAVASLKEHHRRIDDAMLAADKLTGGE